MEPILEIAEGATSSDPDVGLRAVAAPFTHGAVHDTGRVGLYDSYHCSRYNTNTGVLTAEMFRSVFARVRADLDHP